MTMKDGGGGGPLTPRRRALQQRSENNSKGSHSALLTFSPPKNVAAPVGGAVLAAKATTAQQTLLLVKFQESLWLPFGDTNVVGLPRSVTFLMSSPDSSTDVEVLKVPSKKGFSLDFEKTTVDQGAFQTVVVTWTPSNAGGVRESIMLKLTGKGTATVILHGAAVEPPASMHVQSSLLPAAKKAAAAPSLPTAKLQAKKKMGAAETHAERPPPPPPQAAVPKSATAKNPATGVVLSSSSSSSFSSSSSLSSSAAAVAAANANVPKPMPAKVVSAPAPASAPAASAKTTQSNAPAPSSSSHPALAALAAASAVPSTSSAGLTVSGSGSGSSSVVRLSTRPKVFYDENWSEKQQYAFTSWLNYTFTPTEDSAHEDDLAKVLAASECSSGTSCVAASVSAAADNVNIDRSALRTLLLHRRAAKARTAASRLYTDEEFLSLRYRVEEEIKEGRLSVRRDRDMYADLGLRQQIVGLLLSYSTEWLKLGLETVFGEVISTDHAAIKNKSVAATAADADANENAADTTTTIPTTAAPLTDEEKKQQALKRLALASRKQKESTGKPVLSRTSVALKKFVVDRVLGDPAILAKYTRGKCKLPSGAFESRYKDELRKSALRRMLLLVAFLDRGRVEHNILDKVPCLFKIDGEVKSTKELLVNLCRDFMSGEGDFIKHLSHMGLQISYEQKYIDEYDFSVSNLAVDLRDGVRLTRMAEILTGDTRRSLSPSLRVPAVSRLQKLHNVGVALSALEKAGVRIGTLSAKDVVDGNRQGVLALLWRTIVHFKLSSLINKTVLEQEIKDVKRASKRRMIFGVGFKPKQQDEANEMEKELTNLLLIWCQEVCATFGVQVTDFTTSFADGKALCLLVHYYHPAILSRSEISSTTTDLPRRGDDDDNFHPSVSQDQYQEAVSNEQKNVRLAKKRMAELGGIPGMLGEFDSTIVPEEKSMIGCVAYLCSRLIESSAEIQATLVIQSAFRKWWGVKLLHKKKVQALTIWKFWLRRKVGLWERRQKKIGGAVAKIENFILHTKQRRKEVKTARLLREQWLKASTVIASSVRMFLAKKQLHKLRLEFAEFQEYAATIIASFGRIIIAKQALRRSADEQVQTEVNAATAIQTQWRRYTAEVDFLTAKIALTEIQSAARMFIESSRFANKKASSIMIQSVARMVAVKNSLAIQHFAAIVIQKVFRRTMAQIEATMMILCVLKIQSVARGYLGKRLAAKRLFEVEESAQEEFHRQLRCLGATKIQNVARKTLSRKRFLRGRYAAIKIQAIARGVSARSELIFANFTAGEIQRVWRGARESKSYAKVVSSTIKVQTFVRKSQAMDNFVIAKFAAVVIQKAVRRSKVRHAEKVLKAAVVVQSIVRMAKAKTTVTVMKHYKKEVESVTLLQSFVRMSRVRSVVSAQRSAVTCISKVWRKASARSFFFRAVSSAAKIQSVVRGKAALASYKNTIIAATRVQAFARGVFARSELSLTHFAATEIQRMWRGAQQQVVFIMSVLSTIKIQSVCRRYLVAKAIAIESIAATAIQKIGRAMIGRKIATALRSDKMMDQAERLARKSAAKKIQRAARALIRFNKLKQCAGSVQRYLRGHAGRLIAKQRLRLILRLQSLWRGRKARILTNKKMRVIRMKVALANKKAAEQPEMRLGYRTQKALELLLTSKRLAEIMRATCTLEITSRFSEKCCEAFAAAGAPKVLFTLIRTCNRSLPHIELLQYALMTIKNVAKWDHLVDSVATDESVDVLVDLMQTFRDKETILVLCGEILFRVCANVEKCRQKIAIDDNAKRLKGILNICSKKAAIKKVEVKKTGSKAGPQQGICVLESLFQFI